MAQSMEKRIRKEDRLLAPMLDTYSATGNWSPAAVS